MPVHDGDAGAVIAVDPHAGQGAGLVRQVAVARRFEPGIGAGLRGRVHRIGDAGRGVVAVGTHYR